jgi:hypothetical protein
LVAAPSFSSAVSVLIVFSPKLGRTSARAGGSVTRWGEISPLGGKKSPGNLSFLGLNF